MSFNPIVHEGGQAELPKNWLKALPEGTVFIARPIGKDEDVSFYLMKMEDADEATFLMIFNFNLGATQIFNWVDTQRFSTLNKLLCVRRRGVSPDGSDHWADPSPGVGSITEAEQQHRRLQAPEQSNL